MLTIFFRQGFRVRPAPLTGETFAAVFLSIWRPHSAVLLARMDDGDVLCPDSGVRKIFLKNQLRNRLLCIVPYR